MIDSRHLLSIFSWNWQKWWLRFTMMPLFQRLHSFFTIGNYVAFLSSPFCDPIEWTAFEQKWLGFELIIGALRSFVIISCLIMWYYQMKWIALEASSRLNRMMLAKSKGNEAEINRIWFLLIIKREQCPLLMHSDILCRWQYNNLVAHSKNQSWNKNKEQVNCWRWYIHNEH